MKDNAKQEERSWHQAWCKSERKRNATMRGARSMPRREESVAGTGQRGRNRGNIAAMKRARNSSRGTDFVSVMALVCEGKCINQVAIALSVSPTDCGANLGNEKVCRVRGVSCLGFFCRSLI